MEGGIHSLPDPVLLCVFAKLPAADRRTMAAVCKRWRELSDSEDSAQLWETVQITLPHGFEHALSLPHMYSWFLSKQHNIRRLEIDINSRQAWLAVHALLGLVGGQLTHLRIYGDEEGVQEPGSTCAWLALVPHLVSLELANVVDSSVEQAAFPTGLTQLELSNCCEEGLLRLPDQLTLLHGLRSLDLQGGLFDNPLAIERLALCKSLECLDLSNCCLEAVPRSLASLCHLTRLTLNSNPSLGEGEPGAPSPLAALAALTSLQYLELRDCGLPTAPPAIAHLTSLRTVLLGFNDMSGRPVLPPGPWLEGLRMLAMSDAADFQEATPAEVVASPLAPAGNLEALRLNRNPGLRLAAPDLAALAAGKPRLRWVELSEAMLAGPDVVTELAASHPGLRIRVVD